MGGITNGQICAVFGCKNYGIQKDARSMFRFPKDYNFCKKWVVASRRQDLDEVLKKQGPEQLNKSNRICADHFDQKCFRNPKLLSQGLLKGSIPTLLLGVNTPQRPSPKKRCRELSPAAVSSQSSSNVDHNDQETSCTSSTERLPDARLPKRTSMQQEERIKLLEHKLRNSQKVASKYRDTLRHVRKDCAALQSQLNCKSDLFESLKSTTDISTEFIQSQLKHGKRKRKGRRYTDSDKTFALALHYCSPKSYRFMRKHFCLPTVRSLRSWLQGLEIAPGLNENVLSMLKLKSEEMSEADRVVSIVFDEMSLKELISFDARADIFRGYTELPEAVEVNPRKKRNKPGPTDKNNNNDNFETDKPQVDVANEALVFMVRGIKHRFKQVIGYYLTKDAASAESLKCILLEVISKITQAGFTPKVIVCDQGTGNVRLRKLLSITSDNPVYNFEGNKIYFLYDAPHLLKSVRNNLKKYNFKYRDVEYSWKPIVDFFNKDMNMSLRLAPKLKKIHIELPPFSPMRVCLAAQVLSHSVATGILTHVALGSMDAYATHTACFLEEMDSLFDCFNSSKYVGNTKQYLHPISSSSTKHWEFLDRMREKFQEMIVLNSTKKKPPCFEGWIANIAALKLLCADLEQNHSFKYILTRRLTQDCIENLFSVIRSKGGCNITPDASSFRSAIRATIANQILSPSDDSNCEMDMDQFLLKRKELTSCALALHVANDKTKEHDVDDVAEPSAETLNSMAERNAISYVTGWACSRLPHKNCRNKISSFEESYDMEHMHIMLKKYDSHSRMLYPTQNATQLIGHIFNLKQEHLCKLIESSRVDVKKRLRALVNVPSDFPPCLECTDIFIDKSLNVMFNGFIKLQNMNLKRTVLGKKNTKAEKVFNL